MTIAITQTQSALIKRVNASQNTYHQRFQPLLVYRVCKTINNANYEDQCNKKQVYIIILGYLNMTCPRHLQCDYLIDNTICSFDGQCICQSGYVPINESSCGLKFSAHCFSNEICATVNAACIDNKCQCRANYVYRNDKCLPSEYQKYRDKLNFEWLFIVSAFLNESCESDIDCIEIRHSICSKQKCVCEDGYRQINKTTCKIRTAGNFILDQLCFGNVECQGIAYARCIDNKCQCKPQYAKLNETACAPILGGFCWRDSPCAAVNAVCIDYWCQCRDGFLAQSYNKCIKSKVMIKFRELFRKFISVDHLTTSLQIIWEVSAKKTEIATCFTPNALIISVCVYQVMFRWTEPLVRLSWAHFVGELSNAHQIMPSVLKMSVNAMKGTLNNLMTAVCRVIIFIINL